MDTAVQLDFGPGNFCFWLPLPRVIELERNCGTPRVGDTPAVPKSIFVMYDQMSGGLGTVDESPVYYGGGAAMVKDVREVIRCALIGGNSGLVDGEPIEVGPQKAAELVEEYTFPARPFIESVHIAWAILHAAINGIDLKKKAAENAESLKRSEKAA